MQRQVRVQGVWPSCDADQRTGKWGRLSLLLVGEVSQFFLFCVLLSLQDPVRVQLFRTPYCGWGVRALEPIAAGRFVAEYFGEVISHEEGERRGESYDKDKMSYLFDIDFHVEDDESNEKVLVIDAADCGNVSRFLNHSHDPNLVIYSVESESARKDLLRLCFIAVRDILPFEELTFDYRYQLVDDEEGAIPCHCGAVNCTGRLR